MNLNSEKNPTEESQSNKQRKRKEVRSLQCPQFYVSSQVRSQKCAVHPAKFVVGFVLGMGVIVASE